MVGSDRKASMHTTHTGGNQSRGGSHLSHEKNTRSMQLKIDSLQRRLHHEQCRATPSSCGPSSNDDSDLAISLGPKLLLASPFRVIRIIIIGRGGRVHLTKVWTITIWAGVWIRFPSHLLLIGLKVENFLSSLLSQHSLCTMAEQTRWSTLVTSTRGWPFTLGTKP